MKVGEQIEAGIKFTGNTSGLKPEFLMKPDTFSFSLAEGDTDLGADFQYSEKHQNFYITTSQLSIKQGVKYKFRGIGQTEKFAEPNIVVPNGLSLGEVNTTLMNSDKTENGYVTRVKCSFNVNNLINDAGYLFVVPGTIEGKVVNITFDKDYGAFKNLMHREGFLIDRSRISDDQIEFLVTLESESKPSQLKLEMGNTTKSFYEFNIFLSNTYSDPNQTSENQVIAGLNIWTDKAIGCFSAYSSTSGLYQIK